MKKVTLLLMACCVSIMSFAAGGNITCVLNGGVTNDYGWQSKIDMLKAFSADYNTVTGKFTSWGETTVSGEIVNSTYNLMYEVFEHATIGPKWAWLKDYVLVVAAATPTYTAMADLQSGTDGNAYWRTAIDAFFTSTFYAPTAYNRSPDFTFAGLPEAFMPYWKHAFQGPASYDGTKEIILPVPYKAGESFYGWYDNPGFSGGKITSIPVGATGNKSFYAKFGEYIPTCKELWNFPAATTSKTRGVVTFVAGTTAYIQDVTAGLLVEFASAPAGIARGDKITIEGTTSALDEYVKLTNAVLIGCGINMMLFS